MALINEKGSGRKKGPIWRFFSMVDDRTIKCSLTDEYGEFCNYVKENPQAGSLKHHLLGYHDRGPHPTPYQQYIYAHKEEADRRESKSQQKKRRRIVSSPDVEMNKSDVRSCVKCGREFEDVQQLQSHLSMDHLDYIPYQCTYCAYVRVPTEKCLVEHIQQQHPGEPILVTKKFDELKEAELEALLQRTDECSTHGWYEPSRRRSLVRRQKIHDEIMVVKGQLTETCQALIASSMEELENRLGAERPSGWTDGLSPTPSTGSSSSGSQRRKQPSTSRIKIVDDLPLSQFLDRKPAICTLPIDSDEADDVSNRRELLGSTYRTVARQNDNDVDLVTDDVNVADRGRSLSAHRYAPSDDGEENHEGELVHADLAASAVWPIDQADVSGSRPSVRPTFPFEITADAVERAISSVTFDADKLEGLAQAKRFTCTLFKSLVPSAIDVRDVGAGMTSRCAINFTVEQFLQIQPEPFQSCLRTTLDAFQTDCDSSQKKIQFLRAIVKHVQSNLRQITYSKKTTPKGLTQR